MGGDWNSVSGPKRIHELESQLAATKDKWQLQVRRSRQLVAAFQLKLQEKDVQVAVMRRGVDCQMRDLAVKLLQVEATMRKEKRLVVAALVEKDQVIKDQRFEIGRLKALNKELMREKLSSSYNESFGSARNRAPLTDPAGAEQQLLQQSEQLQKQEFTSPMRSNNKRWRSDSDVLTPNMKVVRVGSAVSFLLNKSECSESHSSNEDIRPTIPQQKPTPSQENSSIVATISKVLNTASPNTSGSQMTGSPFTAHFSHEHSNSTSPLSPQSFLDDSMDQSDSGFFSSSGQRSPEATMPTPPLPARGLKPPWIPPKPDYLVAKLKSITGGNKSANLCKSEPNLVAPESGKEMSKVAEAPPSTTAKKPCGILKKTSVSEPNLLANKGLSLCTESAPVLSRQARRPRQAMHCSRSVGDLNEGIVKANFEECNLDSLLCPSPTSSTSSLSCQRNTGDGAETSGCETEDDDDNTDPDAKKQLAKPQVDNKLVHFSGSYEKFLEATGLSQKSILVQRALPHNNHRSVVKPKDVKNRSKMHRMSSFDGVQHQSAVGLVKYWTEPYL